MPVDPATLVVTPAEVATALGLPNPSEDELERVAEAIADAQADVEEYLNRPLIPHAATLTGISPLFGADLDSYKAWPDAEQFDDDITVKTRTANPDGTYDVEFLVGLDGPNTRGIVRYVKAHAVRGLREDEAYGFPLKRVVTSLSADGQSITFVPRPDAEGAPGALPTMKSLRRHRRYSVFQRGRAVGDMWPNYGRRA